MKQNKDGHNLAECKFTGAITRLRASPQQLLVPERFEHTTEIIDIAKEFEYTHGGAPFPLHFWFQHP